MVRILFDNGHNEYVTAREGPINPSKASESRFNWVPLVAKLIKKGFEVVSLDAGPLTDNVLHECDILVLGQPESFYAHSKRFCDDSSSTVRLWGFLEEQEIKSILSFVERGGGLLIIQEYNGEVLSGKRRNNLNDLSKHFGIEFREDTVVGKQYMGASQVHPYITHFDDSHPLTDGVTKIVYLMGCSLVVEPPAKALVFTDHKDLPSDACVLAASEYGKGRAVAIGDATLFSKQGLSIEKDEIRDSIEKLAYNIFYWLSPSDWISSPSLQNVGVESLLRISKEEISLIRKEVDNANQKLDSTAQRIGRLEKRFDASGAPKKVGPLKAVISVVFEVTLILLGFSLAAIGASLVTGTSVIPVFNNLVFFALLLAVALLVKVIEVLYEKR